MTKIMKIFIIVIISVVVFGTMGYFVTKMVSSPSRVIPPEGMLKNSNKESTTTPAADANSIFLKEEVVRKKQRDMDREKCIADVEREYAESYARFKCSTGCNVLQRSLLPNVKEETDRCYFRFPTN